jgi:ariadne-1
MKEWRGHTNFYQCSRFERQQKKSEKRARKKGAAYASKKMSRRELAEEHRRKLERYLRYYDRFLENDQSSRFDQLRDASRRKTEQWQIEYGTAAEVAFIEKATETLIECRRALKFSYVAAYYLDEDDPQRNLFEWIQADLEQSAVRLAEFLESPNIRKAETVDLTRVARSRVENVVSWQI